MTDDLHARLDELVDTDPLRFRDEAFALLRRAELAEAERDEARADLAGAERRLKVAQKNIDIKDQAVAGHLATIERVRALYDIHRERHPKPLWDCITCRMGVALDQPTGTTGDRDA